jgi:hypothetical protein
MIVNFITRMNRKARQILVAALGVEAFGAKFIEDPKERVYRLLEETNELAQAEGVSLERALEISRYVYSRPAGDIHQEVGGVAVTLLAYCHSRGLNAYDLETEEIKRFQRNGPEYYQKKLQVKIAAGITML